MAVLYTPHFIQFSDGNGVPYAGGKLYTYAAGTDTPKATYTTAAGTVENANPVVLDSAGRATIFLSGSYKFTLTTSADVLVKTTDNITSFTESGEIATESIATQDQAESGTDNTKVMTPLRAQQAIAALGAFVNEFRLSLTTAVPVTTSDVVAASTIYLVPYTGNKIALYSSGVWQNIVSAQVSLALSGLTSGKPYDVFAYNNSGVVTLEFLVWTDDTTRATTLTRQDGVLTKSGDATRRYIGTFYTTGTTTTEDSEAKRYLWNLRNQELRLMRVIETDGSWNYTTATWRQANADNANQLNFVTGISSLISARLNANFSNSSASVMASAAIGYDNTTPIAPSVARQQGAANDQITLFAFANVLAIAGKHSLLWLEHSTASGTCTWRGASDFGMSGTILA
jgi:hypothetical protein